jgi:hypothetical protein
MRVRTLVLACTTALALAASAAFAGGAGAASAGASHPSASLSAGNHGKVVAAAARPLALGKCHTAIGTPTQPDGIISWEGQGYDNAGAADFKCALGGKTIKKVVVMGYFGDPGSTPFDVTFYANLGGEPNNAAAPLCVTQRVIGKPTGSSYPQDDMTVMKLGTPCTIAGRAWLEVQAVTENGPWYWETQQEQQKNPADWRDTTGQFGTPCTPGYQDNVYMQDCIFGGDIGERDFMFLLG